ncbi:rRNA pseudouridine synthase [Facklamia sp. DSM 111018]|uniref:Pseudouridine synthase n=1 Tax=Facklamia lactis TaxID=2749967 RepID=A0ABS0LSB1_9LACT|nr:pseudouridine synthase [Facklamia lactis]MBG9987048.1 rRNA pseudouridine synthase [Facklamia lactis]
MRLDKLLSNNGFGSRKEVKALISGGHVRLNGEVVKKPNLHVRPEQDQVEVGGQKVVHEEFVYWMLNKPKGVISATEDSYHSTVLNCLAPEDYRPDLFPVGRLDINTTGLLLLTNDGKLGHRLTSPKHQVAKRYYAEIKGIVTEKTVEAFAHGLDLGDFTTQSAELVIEEVRFEQDMSRITVQIYEGKFHQVKRMFEACDLKVTELHRQTMGPIELDSDLEFGDYRRLSEIELERLKPFGLS